MNQSRAKVKSTSKFTDLADQGLKMNTSTLFRDVVTATCLLAGLLAFVSGQFILSTLLFGMASITSNLSAVKPLNY